MTIGTIRSLGALMHIVFGMTAVAAGLQGDIINRFNVASDTFRFQVGTLQWIIGILIVIERAGLPFHRAMAVGAIRAEMTFMIVVVFVARYAADIQLV